MILVEYPGYSVYNEKKPSEAEVFSDSLAVYDFVNTNVGFSESKIIVFGRSIGSGPACHIGSFRSPGTIILVSPFTSIRSIIQGMIGEKLGALAKDQFCNLAKISSIRSPILIIHGERDEVVPVAHAKELCSTSFEFSELIWWEIDKAKNAEIIIPSKMTHSRFKFQEDLVTPITNFLFKIKMLEKLIQMKSITFPQAIFKQRINR